LFCSDLLDWVLQEWDNKYETLVTQSVEGQPRAG
jgi:hypothetical protein